MYCSACGTQNDDNAYRCTNCGKELVRVGPASPVSIPNYLVQSILVTIFCCWPFGIPAIVYAAKVNGLVGSGDIAGATEASGKAKFWCWMSLGAGLCIGILYALFIIVSIAAEASHH
jgi:hypothetical protein